MVGQAAWTPRNYGQLADEGYRKNIIAYRAVHMVARGCASVPWVLMSGETEVDQHAVLDLLHKPNPLQGGAALFEAVVAYRLLAGNSYLEAATGVDDVTPIELWALRPDRMTVIRGDDGMPQGFQYKVGNEQPTVWDADPITGQGDILHWKTFHPLNDWYGMSALEAAAWSVDQHNEASKWNQTLLQNSARPSGVMQFAPKSGPEKLAPDQYTRLKQQIDEQYTGASRAGRPMLLDGGLTWQATSLSPVDMDFLNTKHTSARDIAQAFGVPAQMLGIPGDNTYSNFIEARLALWEETIIPTLDDLCDALNNWLMPRFDKGGRFRLVYDLDEVPALAPKREAKWTAVTGATFLTTNEKRDALGYQPITDKAADEILISTTTAPLSSVAAQAAANVVNTLNPPDQAKPDGADDGNGESAMAKSLRTQGMSQQTADELARLAYGS
jgi:HK97 family phage portal protein